MTQKQKIASVTHVDTVQVNGRRVNMRRITWTGTTGVSYELYDDATGVCLTEDEAFDWEPTRAQIARAVRGERASGAKCRFCGKLFSGRGQLVANREDRHSPWCCDTCWNKPKA